MDTKSRIRAFVEKTFPLAATTPFRDEESLLDAGIVDSMGVLELVGFLEQEFGLKVTDEELTPENFSSVLSLSEFVKRRSS